MKFFPKIRERCENATEGPWAVEYDSNHFKGAQPYAIYQPIESVHLCRFDYHVEEDRQNADFIAYSREDIPNLLAALDLAVERLEFAEDALRRIYLTTVDDKARFLSQNAAANVQKDLSAIRALSEQEE